MLEVKTGGPDGGPTPERLLGYYEICGEPAEGEQLHGNTSGWKSIEKGKKYLVCSLSWFPTYECRVQAANCNGCALLNH